MEQQDPRIEQLQTEINQNKELVATKYAFKGFGRSTESADKQADEVKKGTELMAGLMWMISAEDDLKRAQAAGMSGKALDAIYDRLYYATNSFNRLKNEATTRRNKSIQEILSYDETLAREGNDKIKIGKSSSKIKKLSGKIKAAESKYRTKSLENVKPAGDKERKVPSLSKIQSLDRAANQRINSLTPL